MDLYVSTTGACCLPTFLAKRFLICVLIGQQLQLGLLWQCFSAAKLAVAVAASRAGCVRPGLPTEWAPEALCAAKNSACVHVAFAASKQSLLEGPLSCRTLVVWVAWHVLVQLRRMVFVWGVQSDNQYYICSILLCCHCLGVVYTLIYVFSMYVCVQLQPSIGMAVTLSAAPCLTQQLVGATNPHGDHGLGARAHGACARNCSLS
jgi:hypothetical protein